jgi:hypothetical protein
MSVNNMQEYLSGQNHPQHTLVTRVIEGFETPDFRSNFDKWPLTGQTPVSEEGRGKVAAMLKQQGVNVKGLLKAAPVKEEVPELLNSAGKLQVFTPYLHIVLLTNMGILLSDS